MDTTTQERFDSKKSINANYVRKYIRKPPSAGIGKAKGTRNTVNQSVREIFQEFVYRNASTAQELYEKVSKKDPAKALQILTNLADFVLPRLARTEVVPSGDPLVSLNPITDAAQAAATYASILGNTKINLNVITFAPPHQTPESTVVAEQGQIPPDPRPPDNVVSLYERLGKE
jgi:hypothetical protein